MKLKLVDNLKGKERILVTSALPYVNYEPHLGHLAGAVLSADVYYKYLKLKEVNAIYICGTDENGSTTEVTARKMGISPRELCDKYHKIHKESYERFGITFTYFGRTISEKHAEITQHIYKKLLENGYIFSQDSIQAYCDNCKIELADRFIIGKCPVCGYENATGGQCEKCGSIIEPNELKDPKCAICGASPKFVKSTHLYLDLPKLKEELRQFILSRTEWAENAKKFSLNLLEDLKPRAITRRLNWGIKVPDTDLVFYVWFDAPIGYISFTYEAFDKNEADLWWKGNTRLVQFMGKDNIPFHSIMFPAQLIGTKEGWVLVDVLASSEYLNYEGGKFSKSQKRGIFCSDAIESGIPIDYWRFYLMYNRPEKSDTDFQWDDFYERINKDLLGNFINFVYRVLSLSERYIPEVKEHEYDKIYDDVIEKVNLMDELMDKIQIRDYVKTMLEIASIGNKYLQENEPWKIQEDRVKAEHVLSNALEIVKVLAIVSQPIIPNIAKQIQDCLYLNEKGIKYWKDLEKPIVGKIKSKRLGEKLEKEKIDHLKIRFAGSDFRILNLRIGKIISVEKVKGSEKLYRFIVDCGKEKRQILAGLQKHYSENELLGRNVVFVANLKPARLMGFESQGMVLAASNDKGEIKLLEAPNSEPGMQVYTDFPYEQNTIITLDDFQRVKLSVKDGKVFFEEKALRTEKEFISCKIDNEETAVVR